MWYFQQIFQLISSIYPFPSSTSWRYSMSRYKFSCKVLYLLESLYLRIYSALLSYITWKDKGRRFVFFSFPLSSYFYWVPYFESGPEKGGVFLLVLRLVFSHSVHTKFFFLVLLLYYLPIKILFCFYFSFRKFCRRM